jgi:hypothetical protein
MNILLAPIAALLFSYAAANTIHIQIRSSRTSTKILTINDERINNNGISIYGEFSTDGGTYQFSGPGSTHASMQQQGGNVKVIYFPGPIGSYAFTFACAVSWHSFNHGSVTSEVEE